MTVQTMPDLYGSPREDLYDSGVVKLQRMGVEDARKNLGKIIKAAQEEGIHTDISKYGGQGVVAVPREWYRRMRELSGEPTDI